MVILNASYIPDRTECIIDGKESPLPYLLEACETLVNAGCDLITIACNTAHYFYDEIQKNCKIKILNMIDLVAQRLSEQNISDVFLMATAGIIKTGVYTKYLNSRNINILPADENEIEIIMKVIYDIKASKVPDLSNITAIAEKNYELGCRKIILGCTELPLIKKEMINIMNIANADVDFSNLFIDSIDVLKDEIIKLFGIIM
jgi:aspartate racemase